MFPRYAASITVLSLMGTGLLGVGLWKRPRAVEAASPAVPQQLSRPRRALAPGQGKLAATQVALQQRIAALPRASEPDLLHPPLQMGDLAPDFNLPDQEGKRHHLAALRGKTVVLSFYPQDFTYACTASAVSLSDVQPQILARGAVVFGVSVQNTESKNRFARDFDLQIPLLADASKEAARAYRVLNSAGEAARVTFMIGPDGRIQNIDQNVHVATHGPDVLAWFKAQRHS